MRARPFPTPVLCSPGHAFCVQLRSRSAAFSLNTGVRSPAFRKLRSAAFAFSCVQLNTDLRSAAFRLLRSAAFRVQLRSAFCVRLCSAFGCVRVQLRSAFSCVLRSAFSCVLRSAAFAFSCVQPEHSQAHFTAPRWAYSVGTPPPRHALLAVMEALRVVRMHAVGFVYIYYYHKTFGDRLINTCLPS